MFNVKNPLPRQIVDPQRANLLYRDLRLIPYAGNSKYSSHIFLRLLCDLYDLSPSRATCIEDLIFWGFDGDAEITNVPVENLKSENTPVVDYGVQVAFAEWLDTHGIPLSKIIDIQKMLFRSYRKMGIAYLHLVEETVNGQVGFSLSTIDPGQVMLLDSEPGDPQSIVVSNSFFDMNGTLHDDPKVIRVFPDFTEMDGRRETVFFLRNTRDEGLYYGRPQDLSAVFAMFTEWSKLSLMSKIANSETGTKNLLAFERPAMNLASSGPGGNHPDEFEAMITQMRMKMTAKGSYETFDDLGAVQYPHGGNKPELISLPLNRDDKYSRFVLEKAADYIFANNRCSKLISNMSQVPGSIGGNVLIDQFLVWNTGTVNPMRRKWQGFWKKVFGVLTDHGQAPQFSGLGIAFEDKITTLVTALRNGETDTINTGRSDNLIEGAGPVDAEV